MARDSIRRGRPRGTCYPSDDKILAILVDGRLEDPGFPIKAAIRAGGLVVNDANVRRIQRRFRENGAELMVAARERAKPRHSVVGIAAPPPPAGSLMPTLFSSSGISRVIEDMQRQSRLMEAALAPWRSSMESFSKTVQAALKGADSLGYMRSAALYRSLLGPKFPTVFDDPVWRAALGQRWPR